MILLTPEFFIRETSLVAMELIGKFLKHDNVVLKITETEAYCWPNDSANHCRAGRTKRNEPMWGPPGKAYVYLCYGMHNMLNLVTGPEGEGSAVLIRSAEVVDGLEIVKKRRGGKTGPVLLTGPGKVGVALGIDVSFSGHDLTQKGGLEALSDGTPIPKLLMGPRIGIDYADPVDIKAPLRFGMAGSNWVSHKTKLVMV